MPAYAAMRRPGALADRMLEILMAGVSSRKYGRVIPVMADTVGLSKSAVSREAIEASEWVLKELMERRLDGWDLLVVYLDGIQFGAYHVLAAVGVDDDGKKHVLGVREGASENAEVARALLEGLVERGLDPGRRRLFAIDGSKAPRLRKCLGSTNLIDSTHSGVRQKTRTVTNWKNGAMGLRRAAASFIETEKNYRRIIGYDQLGSLKPTSAIGSRLLTMRKVS